MYKHKAPYEAEKRGDAAKAVGDYAEAAKCYEEAAGRCIGHNAADEYRRMATAMRKKATT